METFFQEELQDTVNKVRALQEEGCLSFLLITDSHIFPPRERFYQHQKRGYENMRALNEAVPLSATFHLGDIPWVNWTPETLDYWQEENIEKWFAVTRENYCAANANSFFVAGNHDSPGARPPEPATWHRQMVAPQKDRITGYAPDKGYYYVDFESQKVRAICMLSCFRDEEGTYQGIYPEQVEWLESDALRAPEGWRILLFTHIYPEEENYYCSRKSENTQEFAKFLWAFQNKVVSASELFPGDFRDAGDAKIAAMFFGHGHTDWAVAPGVFPFYAIETGSDLVHVPKAGSWRLPEGCAVPDRKRDTVTEALWDVVVYNPGKNTLDMIRFGSGEDRHFQL